MRTRFWVIVPRSCLPKVIGPDTNQHIYILGGPIALPKTKCQTTHQRDWVGQPCQGRPHMAKTSRSSLPAMPSLASAKVGSHLPHHGIVFFHFAGIPFPVCRLNVSTGPHLVAQTCHQDLVGQIHASRP